MPGNREVVWKSQEPLLKRGSVSVHGIHIFLIQPRWRRCRSIRCALRKVRYVRGAAKLVLKIWLSMRLDGKSLDLGLRLANWTCEPNLAPACFLNKALWEHNHAHSFACYSQLPLELPRQMCPPSPLSSYCHDTLSKSKNEIQGN